MVHDQTKVTVTVAKVVITKIVVRGQASAAKALHLTTVQCNPTFVRLNLATSAQRLKASQRQWFLTLILSNQKVQKTFAVTK